MITAKFLAVFTGEFVADDQVANTGGAARSALLGGATRFAGDSIVRKTARSTAGPLRPGDHHGGDDEHGEQYGKERPWSGHFFPPELFGRGKLLNKIFQKGRKEGRKEGRKKRHVAWHEMQGEAFIKSAVKTSRLYMRLICESKSGWKRKCLRGTRNHKKQIEG